MPWSSVTAVVLVGRGRPAWTLARCLRSLEEQTRPPQEVLVVLNGVADGGLAQRICEQFGAQVTVLETDVGCPAGRNAGARAARGEFLVFVDDDGQLSERGVETAVDMLTRWDCVAVAGAVQSGLAHQEPRLIPKAAGVTAYFSGGVFGIRRDAFLGCGGYWDHSRRQGEELDLAVKLFRREQSIMYSPAFVLYHETRIAFPGEPLAVLSAAAATRVFFAHYSFPVALAAYIWRVARNIWYVRRSGWRRIVATAHDITSGARMGLRERDAMGVQRTAQFMSLARTSPNRPSRAIRPRDPRKARRARRGRNV